MPPPAHAFRTRPVTRIRPPRSPWFIGWIFQLPRIVFCVLGSTPEFFVHAVLFWLATAALRPFFTFPGNALIALAATGVAGHYMLYRRLEAWIVRDPWARLAMLSAHAAAGLWAGWAVVYALTSFFGARIPDAAARGVVALVPVLLNVHFFCGRHGITRRNILVA